MNKFKNKRIVLSLLILGISIGFAALATQLAILGTANVSKQTWNVHWENVNVVKGATLGETPVIDQAGTTVTYEIDLDKPGDTFSFTVDAKNDGSLDAMITNLSNLVYNSSDETTPIDLPNYINYEITYSDGAPISNNQLLKSTQKETYLVTVKYDEDHLASSNISLKFKLSLDYQMDDGTGVEVLRGPQYCYKNMNQTVSSGTVCKRAEVLHTEVCSSGGTCTSKNYRVGDVVAYGNCGTNQTINPGDAFDCDVNGDGNFDEENERFYYVSPRDADEQSEYATLIYYKNLTNPSYNPLNNYRGPAIDAFPSTSNWSNPKLNSNMTRQIKNENGDSYISLSNGNVKDLPEFTYTDKAARYLTYQEVYNGCYNQTTNSFNKCTFLGETSGFATSYGSAWWLENPYSESGYSVWYISSGGMNSWYNSCTNNDGLRPAIEVKFEDIEY